MTADFKAKLRTKLKEHYYLWIALIRIRDFLKKNTFLVRDIPSYDGRRMSLAATEWFLKKPHLDKNLNTPLKRALELMAKEMHNSTYFGIQTLKLPLDFWIYQEIIFEIRPDIIIEIGNLNGGSTLALAHLLDNVGRGRVIGLDIDQKHIPPLVRNHPRITLIEGDACNNLPKVKTEIKHNEKVLIIEDSSHTYENTLRVLQTFSQLVTVGSYFIVEDSVFHHGLDIGPDPGPYEAIENFIKEDGNFEIDRSRERFLITWNVKGYLRRIR